MIVNGRSFSFKYTFTLILFIVKISRHRPWLKRGGGGGQAFNIAYHEFLTVNRLNLGELEDMEYNGILEQQKILGEELSLLADESKTKKVCF